MPRLFLKSLWKNWELSRVFIPVLLISSFFTYLIANRELYYMPNVDVFSYIDDGRDYIQGSLPGLIHAPPGNSILIGLLAPLLNRSDFPELLAAKLINAISVSGSLVAVWLFARRFLNEIYSGLLVVTCLVHPLSLLLGVGVTSEALFACVVMFSLYFNMLDGKKNWAWVLGAVAFLVRSEGILLFISYGLEFLLQLSKEKSNWKNLLRNNVGMLIALTLFGSWNLLTYFHNSNLNIPHGNFFIAEIIARAEALPELRFVSNYHYLLVAPDKLWSLVTPPSLMAGAFLLLVFGLLVIRTKSYQLIPTLVFIYGYIVLHLLFPAYDIRYFFPILFLSYLVFFITVGRLSVNKVVIGIILGWFSVLSVLSSHFVNRNTAQFSEQYYLHKREVRLVTEWLENVLPTKYEEMTLVAPVVWEYTAFLKTGSYFRPFEREVTRGSWNYYQRHFFIDITKLSLVSLRDSNLSQCSDLRCVVSRLPSNTIVFIYDNQSENLSLEDVTDRNMLLLHDEESQACLRLIERIEYKNRWSELRKWDFEKCPRSEVFPG